MDSRSALSLERQLAAVHDWWREAGVDMAFEDEPRAWLAEPEGDSPALQPAARKKATARPAESETPAIGGPPASWPRELAGFAQWWLAEPSLDPGGTRPRVPPRGKEGAKLMIVVPMPEAQDSQELLSGVEGKLLASLLAALGLDIDAIYLASALPRYMAEPDWAGLDRAGLGAVLLHHLALARPERLLVLGRSILPLLGHDPAQGHATINQTAIQGTQVPTLAGVAPARLLENARQRAMLWRKLLDWTDADL